MFGLKEEIWARRRRNNFMQWERPPLKNGQVAGGDKDQVAVFLFFFCLFFNYENQSFGFWSQNFGHLVDDLVFC